jgi:predicted DCC family thiol-disulfide oxidoreductase YuxK
MASRDALRSNAAQANPGDGTHLFFDGTCGLCHRAVRLVLRADRRARVRFAPIEGPTFRRLVGDAEARLPDSLVLRLPDGELLTRSAAVVALLRRLGGGWGLLATVMATVPTVIGDRLYDGVARARRRLFRRPAAACPTVRPDLLDRFDP